MSDLYLRSEAVVSPSVSASAKTILICIHRIEDLLDEEISLLDKGLLHELERVNIRKSHLLMEFDRLSTGPAVDLSREIQLRLETCRRKAERNFEALETFLRAMEDLNRLILDHLRREESDGTYSRPVKSQIRG